MCEISDNIFFIIDIRNLSLWMQHIHTTWSTTLDTPFIFTILGGKSLNHEESNGDALITLSLLHFVPLVLKLLPILLQVIQKNCNHNIYECLPIALLKWLAIEFPILLSTRSTSSFVNFPSQNLVSSKCDEGLSTSPLNKEPKKLLGRRSHIFIEENFATAGVQVECWSASASYSLSFCSCYLCSGSSSHNQD
jgi:hypothetical protein